MAEIDLVNSFFESRGYTPFEWFSNGTNGVYDESHWPLLGLDAVEAGSYGGPSLETDIESGRPFSTGDINLVAPPDPDELGRITSTPLITGSYTTTAIDGQGNETSVINNVNIDFTTGGGTVAFDGTVTSEVISSYEIQAIDAQGIITTYNSLADIPATSQIFSASPPLDGVVVLRYDFDITYTIEGEGAGFEGVSSLFVVVKVNYSTFAEALIAALCAGSTL